MRNVIFILFAFVLLFGCRDGELENPPPNPPQTTTPPPDDKELELKDIAGMTIEEVEAEAPWIIDELKKLCGEKYEDIIVPIVAVDGNFSLMENRWMLTEGAIMNAGAAYESIIVMDVETGMQYAAIYESDAGGITNFSDSDDLPEYFKAWMEAVQ